MRTTTTIKMISATMRKTSFPRAQALNDVSICQFSARRLPALSSMKGPHGQRHAAPGHCLTRAIKDLFPRYRTMRGLPLRAESRLGYPRPARGSRGLQRTRHPRQGRDRSLRRRALHPQMPAKRLAVHAGVGKAHERLGFWIHLDEAYVTYHQSYVESVWWSLKNLFDRGLLYQGHKIVWWWAQGGTALSSGRSRPGVSRGGRSECVCPKFPLVDDAGKPTIVVGLDHDALDACPATNSPPCIPI
jgi:hypothetical protein